MIIKAIKFLFALCLIPLVIACSISFYEQLKFIQEIGGEQRYLLFGAGFYILCFILSFRMDYIYVFGHEFVHTLGVWAFGGKIKSFKVSKDKGSVSTDKSNLIIALGPYLVPVWTIIISLLYFLINLFYQSPWLFSIFLFLVGFTFISHIILTIDRLRIEQTDFFYLGHLGSIVLIYVINLVVISAILCAIFKDISFNNFITAFWHNTKNIYTVVFKQIFL